MGGLGSGSMPKYHGNGNNGGGRRKTTAIAVTGTGTPEKPKGLPEDVSRAFDAISALVEGVAYSQDGMLIEECARLWVRQQQLHGLQDASPGDLDLIRVSLAVGRALLTSLGKLGLTPRDRQILLVPKLDDEPTDPIAAALDKRRFFQGGPTLNRNLKGKK